MTAPGLSDPRPGPRGPADHPAAACVALALAAGAGLLVGWWLWHGPRLALETLHPAGGRGR